MLTVKNKDGECFLVYPDDERWLNGELVGSTKGFTNCFDTYSNTYKQIETSKYYNDDNRYLGLTSGKVACRLKNNKGKYTLITQEEFHNSKELYETATSNKVVCKDKLNNIFCVSIDNKDYQSGKLKPLWYGLKHNETTKEKMRLKHKENKHQQGEKNSQYGTCWITKDGINKKIKKTESEQYLSNGWILGRVMKPTINKT